MGLSVGLSLSPVVGSVPHPLDAVAAAERLGFDFISVSDHLHGPTARFETWTLLAWLGASTSRIRLATRVLAVPYRNPAVLAKMAESFHRLSGGRLILGLGSGAVEDEFAAFGLGRASAVERVGALEEALLIARGLWSQESYTLAGRHYRTEAAQIEPKPDRAIPIWLGAYRRRGLELVGRLGDGWIPTLELAPPEVIPEMRRQIHAAARRAGREPSQIELVYNLEASLDPAADLPPHVLRGSATALADRLLQLAGLGFAGFNLSLAGGDWEGQLDVTGREVLPALHAAD